MADSSSSGTRSLDPWRIPWPDRFGAFWQTFLPGIGPWLADLETRTLLATDELPPVTAPVFVCGMARSGSTILLESLARLPGFTSHRYADFPMLWTPWWWNRLRAALPKSTAPPAERAHRDRIRVTRESPEAFEEPLWAHHFPHASRDHDVLDGHTRNAAFDVRFEQHIAKLLKARGADRYLSKGNYNTLRIPYLARLFPDARFLVPIRSPGSHVASLMRQDAWHASAPKATLQHIAARGHHEFGPMKRWLRVPGADLPTSQTNVSATADDWLVQWLAIYGFALDLYLKSDFADRLMFVPHERLCAAPESGFGHILDFIGVPSSDEVSTWLTHSSRSYAATPTTDDGLAGASHTLVIKAKALFEACDQTPDWQQSANTPGDS